MRLTTAELEQQVKENDQIKAAEQAKWDARPQDTQNPPTKAEREDNVERLRILGIHNMKLYAKLAERYREEDAAAKDTNQAIID